LAREGRSCANLGADPGTGREISVSPFYRIAYRLGFAPWEKASETHGHLISALIDREEPERTRPYGRALDLGCGPKK